MESISYGVEGTAMPAWIDYGLSRNDIGDLLNYIRSLNPVKQTVSQPAPPAGSVAGKDSAGAAKKQE